jgi:tRNA-dihydrouridine synthase B
MIARTGVDGVTIARGAMGNPWIFREVRALAAGQPLPAPPSVRQQRDAIEEHHRLAESIYGPKRADFVIRNYGIKYARMHPQPEQVRDAFAGLRQAERWREILDRWYGE